MVGFLGAVGIFGRYSALASRSLRLANSTKRRAKVLLIRASAAPSAPGRPAKKTDGFVTADTNGTRSIPGASALPASTSGLRPSAFLVAAGRRIPSGIRTDSRRKTPRAVKRAFRQPLPFESRIDCPLRVASSSDRNHCTKNLRWPTVLIDVSEGEIPVHQFRNIRACRSTDHLLRHASPRKCRGAG